MKTAKILLMIFLLQGCSPALYKPAQSDAQRSGMTVEVLSRGKKAYVNKCGSCHNLSRPEQYTEKEWSKILPVMQQKARCTEEEIMLINSYIKAGIKKD